ncbi:cell division protein SepF [Candidatus Woesearchaeota archaeon]|nr:cell division protein SepF [Candidatus Woesearchaeota archaeon]
MKSFFLQLKDKLTQPKEEVQEEESFKEYVELDHEQEEKSKIIVRPYTMEEFEDIKPVLDALREGSTIALINIRPLKDKDIIELKRAINKLRKTCDAIEGDIAGFGEDYIVVVPYFAQIHRAKEEALE